ncbi:MAG: response regulator [Thermodesulfobacteriota bacterium]
MAYASEKKILVVDDEPDVRNFLATCIEDAGFHVETASNGEEALEKIESDPPDLMTLDMVMPRKSGIQVMRTLRQHSKCKNLPVIVITAHAHDEFGSEDLKSFNAFVSGHRPRYLLEKPVSPQKLVKAICEILSVEAADDTAPVPSDQETIVRLVKSSDQETRKKIIAMLSNQSL